MNASPLMAETATKHNNLTGIHPIAALGHMATIIHTLDGFIERPPRESRPETMKRLMRRMIYVRNTLAVSFDLWQNDTHRRLLKSKSGFYIFSMTSEESTGFFRRMGPGLRFAAEDLRNLAMEFDDFSQMSYLASGVEKLAEDAKVYANENKACLALALDSGVNFTPEPVLMKSLPIESD